MKKITKNLFIIVLIASLITTISAFIWPLSTITNFQSDFNSLYSDTQNGTDTVAASGNVFLGFLNFFLGSSLFIVVLVLFILLLPIILVPILYLISWLIHLHKDTRKNTVTSIVLSSIGIIINVIIMYVIIEVFSITYTINSSYLLIIAFLSNFICIIFPILYALIKKAEIKKIFL